MFFSSPASIDAPPWIRRVSRRLSLAGVLVCLIHCDAGNTAAVHGEIADAGFPTLPCTEGGAPLAPSAASAGGDDRDAGGPLDTGRCGTGDQDGILGGNYVFDVTVTDDGFSPRVLKAQNTATITLQLTNHGTQPHGFVLACIPTPNTMGCPAQSCFPGGAKIAPIEPGASVTATFAAPEPEGVYLFGSSATCDSGPGFGQFILD